MKLYKNGYILQEDCFILKDFAVHEGKFIMDPSNSNATIIDLEEKKVIPGLIDIHTHGAYGVDFNVINEDSMKQVCAYFNSQGVTSVFPTLLTDDTEVLLDCIKTIVEAKQSGLDTIEGIHIEGPFICEEYKACMPPQYLQLPSISLFDKFYEVSNGLFKVMTMSAELEGANTLASYAKEKGIVISLGHSGATQEQALSFIEAGASNATHLGNAMRQPTQHNLNVCGSVLYSDIYSEIIVDGVHINKTVVDYWFKVRPHDKMILVTDSIMATGLADGEYTLGINEVIVENGDAKLKHAPETRAGSTLKAIDAVKNTSQFIRLPFQECVKFMTKNPALSLDIYDTKGSIDEGKDADFIVLDDSLDVLETYVKGNLVYTKKEC